jgi:hypothetical protein|tara:strand:+ start:1309 stop:1506 length:198 start_codon:yes stop_codon:yes gene_type:complete
MIKKSLLLFAAALVLAGCSSTVTVGPDANAESYLSATAGAQGAAVTLPFVKGTVGTTATQSTKKK